MNSFVDGFTQGLCDLFSHIYPDFIAHDLMYSSITTILLGYIGGRYFLNRDIRSLYSLASILMLLGLIVLWFHVITSPQIKEKILGGIVAVFFSRIVFKALRISYLGLLSRYMHWKLDRDPLSKIFNEWSKKLEDDDDLK